MELYKIDGAITFSVQAWSQNVLDRGVSMLCQWQHRNYNIQLSFELCTALIMMFHPIYTAWHKHLKSKLPSITIFTVLSLSHISSANSELSTYTAANHHGAIKIFGFTSDKLSNHPSWFYSQWSENNEMFQFHLLIYCSLERDKAQLGQINLCATFTIQLRLALAEACPLFICGSVSWCFWLQC